jgi:Rieske Fe-S protein
MQMAVNRREFVILTAGLVVAGCVGENSPVKLEGVTVDAGPASDYAADGVYDKHRKDGFFVVRQGAKLFVISSICTHRHCIVSAEPDHSFHCKCHGSEYDPDGKVTEGPAIRNLPVLPSSIDESQHLIIHALSV